MFKRLIVRKVLTIVTINLTPQIIIDSHQDFEVGNKHLGHVFNEVAFRYENLITGHESAMAVRQKLAANRDDLSAKEKEGLVG